MFVPVIMMLCSEELSKYTARIVRWATPTKIAISCDYYSLHEVENLCAIHRCPMLFLPCFGEPAFYRENANKFTETRINHRTWAVASENMNFRHWQLERIQHFARKAWEEQTQDCHSKEWQKWLTEQALYYNNGFYECDKRHSWKKTSAKDTSERLSGTCELIYTASEERWDNYSHATAYANIIKRKEKYIVYGEGGETCASDWMSFTVFWVFNTEEEMLSKMKTWKFNKKEPTDMTNDFLEFINSTPSAARVFQEIR